MTADVSSNAVVSLDTMLPDLLARPPHVRAVLDRYGLAGCGGERGPVESLGFFARTHGVNEDRLMREIQYAIEHPDATPDIAAPTVADTIYRRYFLAGIIAILT